MGFFTKTIAIATTALFISAPALADNDIIYKDGQAYMELGNGKLVRIERAVAVEASSPEIPKAIPIAEPITLPKEEKPQIKTTPAESLTLSPENSPLLESAIVKETPLEDFDFSEIENSAEYEDSDGVLGAGALIVAIGIYAVRRIAYLNQHPGLKASNELQREINKLDGLAKRTAALQAKLGIEQKIIGNKLVLFLKPGFTLKGQISKLKSELHGLELEWKKQDISLTRLEEKIDAEHLRRRQEVFLALDNEQNELRQRKRTALASISENFIPEAVAKEAQISETQLQESNNKLKRLKSEITTLESTHRALLDRIQGSGDTVRFADHPLFVENQALLQELRKTAEKYRVLKFQAFSQTANMARNEEIKRTEEKLKALRPQAAEAIERSYAKQSEDKALDLRIATRDAEKAEKRNQIAQAQLQNEIANFSEMKARSLAVLDQEIADSIETVEFFRSISTQNEGEITDSIPFHVNSRLDYEDPEAVHKPNTYFRDLDLARSRLELAHLSSAEDKFNKEAEILDKINDRLLAISLKDLEKKKKNLSKSESGDFWITQLREEALRRVSNKYKIFNSHAFEDNYSFLKLIAGDNQSVNAEDAEIARRLIRETYSDLDNQFNEGRNFINRWYLKGDVNQDMQIYLYHTVRKLRPISIAGSNIEQGRELSQRKREIASQNHKMRYVAAANVSGNVVDPVKNRSLAESTTLNATGRPTTLKNKLAGCLTTLRRQVAIF